MAIIELDARFPTAIPLEAASLLTGEVSYTEEVPIKVRWAIADAGGHSVSDADVLVTTDSSNEEVQIRLDRGERLYSVGLASAVLPAELPPGKGTAGSAPAEPEFNVSADDPLGIGVSRSAAVSSAGGASATDPADADASVESEPGADSGEDADGPGFISHSDGQVIEVVEVPTSTLPALENAVELMELACRRGEWEARQTHSSLLPYLLEESYEFIDAVNEHGDILGELSDLLLQVLFHAEIADDFDIEDVAEAFTEKLRSRSPYLFEDADDADDGMVPVDEQERAWNEGRGGPRSEPPVHLPALALAEETIRRARQLGMSDSEIPVALLAPTPGLELEGGAESRTRAIAREFLASITEPVEDSADDYSGEYDDGEFVEDFAAEAEAEVADPEVDAAWADEPGDVTGGDHGTGEAGEAGHTDDTDDALPYEESDLAATGEFREVKSPWAAPEDGSR